MFSALSTLLQDSEVLEDAEYSGVATIETPRFETAYNQYIWLILSYMPATDFTNLYFRCETGGSFDTGANYDYAVRGIRDDGTLTNSNAASQTFMRWNFNGIGGVSGGFTNEGLAGYVLINKPRDSVYTHLGGEICYRNSFNQTCYAFSSSGHNSASDVTRLRMFSSSGNIDARMVLLGVGNGQQYTENLH